MKTPEEILDKVMEQSPYNANFHYSKDYIIQAMIEYRNLEDDSWISKITKAFRGEEDVILICSEELTCKINNELSSYNFESQGFFKNESVARDIGMSSFYHNGVSIHYTHDFKRFIEGLSKMLNHETS